MEPAKDPPINPLPRTRGYQQEMLEESLKNNIIIALDTGSGKTHIAILRMKAEVEHHPVKVSWFLAPTVTLCEQQTSVIRTAIPVPVRFISGASDPDQWKDKALWHGVLATHKIVVSTPQVLLNALRHGYISMGKDISLIVFDEAHHAVRDEPYNRIMKEFYSSLPPRVEDGDYRFVVARPMILGLTASPIYGGDVERAFRALETNLDCVIRAPRINRVELGQHVYRPRFCHILYEEEISSFSTNLASLKDVVRGLKIDEDPYVISLRKRLTEIPAHAPERARLDQKLSKAIYKKDTFAHRGLRDFERTADAICLEVGAWAADWYVFEVLERVKLLRSQYNHIFLSWRESEKAYLQEQLSKVAVIPPSYDPDDIADDVSDKVRVLVDRLLQEKADSEAENEAYSGIIFVQRRDIVYALATVLMNHPATKEQFRIGCLVGSSDNPQRHSFLDITRTFLEQAQDEILMDFRLGEKNLLISTSVAEEGIDIQACGSVIRWDLPPNMASWAQSRGRARRKRSTFTLMFAEGSAQQSSVATWEKLEQQMTALYSSDRERQISALQDDEDEDDDEDEVLRVESTGAVLTLHSAIGHLEHFCAVMPNGSHTSHQPMYDVDPPDMPEGWHALETKPEIQPHKGPFGATVILPKLLAPELRVFKVGRNYPRKISAQRHVAFKAYKTLYEVGMLNEHLLPLTSTIEPHLEEEVKAMLKDIDKRAGTTSVSVQMDPWTPAKQDMETDNEDETWWVSRLEVDGLPSLTMFTRRCLPSWENGSGPTLFRRGHPPLQVRCSLIGCKPAPNVVEEARLFTRQLFWCIHGARMQWDDLDFQYLFLPAERKGDGIWDVRRSWLAEQATMRRHPFLANARHFGEQFGYPEDLTLIRMGFGFDKACQFVRWKYDEMSEEEEARFSERYARLSDLDFKYPLLVVRHLPPRTNFLLPLPPKPEVQVKELSELILSPDMSGVMLYSSSDVEYSTLLPSILRATAVSITVESLRETLFHSTPLYSIPLGLLTVAVTAPVAQERHNYQRLETLGDTVLKFLMSIQLLTRYPLWHEGYLTRRKDHSVANVRLAQCAVGKELYSWIIRDRMLGKKWKPTYFSSASSLAPQPIEDSAQHQNASPASIPELKSEGPKSENNTKKIKKKKSKANSQELSTKVLADVVESLIGAAFIHGSFDLALECIRVFGLKMEWETLPNCISTLLSRIEPTDDDMPTQLSNVETMLGYSFKRKFLLIEALSHASHQENYRTVSYERMEFLGDSVVDMIVTDYLYHAPGKQYSPGHIHLRRSALVNAHMLAYICLRTHVDLVTDMPKTKDNGRVSLEHETQTIYLWQCMQHSSPRILDDQAQTFARFKKIKEELDAAFASGSIFPWAALLRMQAPKFFSDMIESLMGAAYLDSGGDLDTVRGILRKLGHLDILERVVKDGVDVLHPVSRVSLWASKADKQVQYRIQKEKGEVTCVVSVDEEDAVSMTAIDRGHASTDEVRFMAAEELIKQMGLRDVGVNYEELKKRRKQRYRGS